MEKVKRPSKDDYYIGIAHAVSMRSTCIRAHAGAVIVLNDRILSTGYSGSCRGDINCCDIGECERMRLNIKPGENYEKCKSVHAEANALLNTSSPAIGGKMYLYFERFDEQNHVHGGPCTMCWRMIKNAGIKEFVICEIVQGVPHYNYYDENAIKNKQLK